MSLIFDALKRDHNDSLPIPEPSRKAAAKGRGMAFGRPFSSPVILAVMAVIFLSGVLVAHGVQSFSAQTDDAPHTVGAPVPRMVAYASQPDAADADTVQGPVVSLPLHAIDRQHASLEDAHAPSAENSMPQSGDSPGMPPGISPEVTPEVTNDQGTDIPAAAGSHRQPSEKVFPAPAAYAALPSKETHTREPATPVPAGSAPVDSDHRVPAIRNIPSITARPEAAKSPMNPTPAPAHPKTSVDLQRERRSREHLKIARLAAHTMEAIQAGDDAAASASLAEIEKLKGAQDIFVLKLKAYRMIQQGGLKTARDLLFQALALKPDDVEAGLNMAVIDMLEGRRDQARQRLTGLQARHPEVHTISAYLSRLDR